MLKSIEKVLSPIQLLSLGYVVIILLGAIILMLPISSTNNSYQFFVDSLFTSASAVSTTGLVVVDTGTYYSTFGEIVILILIQIGGLGYMLFFVVFTVLLTEKLSISGKKYLREAVTRNQSVDLIKFVKLTLIYTLVIEGIGTLGYYLVWVNKYPAVYALYSSFFHSVSAFCTAGFGLYPDSLSSYSKSIIINFNTFFLVITGGIGFFVLYDIINFAKQKIKKNNIARLSLHSKLVLSFTFSLFVFGTVIILISEPYNLSENILQNILNAFFQSVSASTTVGFNTVDITIMSNASLFVMIILMFIGASPGSTGGGIKTTSFAASVLSSIASLKGKNAVTIFKRTISHVSINKANAQIFVALTSTIIITLILSITEKFSFIKILFEATSAFGTVGLSAGITSGLSTIGKLLITILMIIGRVGPLAIGLFFVNKNGNNNYAYPEEEIFTA
ncbi:MAG TPA: potassium transporter TrkG [Ignavibacteriaceae bacterium]|jgi:trk/ktr system potassium uptake protein